MILVHILLHPAWSFPIAIHFCLSIPIIFISCTWPIKARDFYLCKKSAQHQNGLKCDRLTPQDSRTPHQELSGDTKHVDEELRWVEICPNQILCLFLCLLVLCFWAFGGIVKNTIASRQDSYRCCSYHGSRTSNWHLDQIYFAVKQSHRLTKK